MKRLRPIVLVLFLLLVVPSAASATNYDVNDLADAPADTCLVGTCTLRDAITDANANGGFDTITFSTLAGGTISLGSDLPFITDPLTIDGETATGWTAGSPAIELDGTAATTSGLRLDTGSDGSVIQGLVINRFPAYGIVVANTSGSDTIRGNFIGTDLAGTAVDGNGAGVAINGGGVTVGGPTLGDRNVISGNNSDGIIISNFGAGNQVLGNYIGTDKTGSLNLGNSTAGINAGVNVVAIGGPGAGEGNLISGNGTGITLSNGADVIGNSIGTNAAGNTAIGNSGDGISVTGFGSISDPIQDNLISGNGGWGIHFDGVPGFPISGNRIGTDAAGTSGVPNLLGGVDLENSTTSITSSGDTVAFNVGPGFNVADAGSTGNDFDSVSLFSNSGAGIDLGADGITPNDPLDPDLGANFLQNFPVLTLAETSASGTLVEGYLNSTPSSNFNIDVYSNPTCDPSGNGEAKTILAANNAVTTDESGVARFSFPLPGLPVGETQVTAVATDTATKSVSELSPCILATEAEIIVPPPPPPPPPPPVGPVPVTGKTGVVEPVSGVVRIKTPGAKYRILREGEAIPVGSIVDATKGRVRITTATGDGKSTQTADFYGGAFKLTQAKGSTLVTLVLVGGNFKICKKKRRHKRHHKRHHRRSLPFSPTVGAWTSGPAPTRSHATVRKLWGSGKGRFRTKGKRGAATVRGTKWLTADRCDGTFFKVAHGIVDVKDFGKPRKRITLTGGKHYLARGHK